jgi:uncharacterized repeat protein (TIGR01451 family)
MGPARRGLAPFVALLLAMMWVPAMLTAAPANADTQPIQVTASNTNCDGVITTPGSENTDKKLIGGTLQPGGDAIYEITYPIDPADIGQDFDVIDCPVLGGDVHGAQAYQFSFVPNNTSFTVTFEIDIPADTPIGTTDCNYAKTVASPSAPQASNRKAGPACFTVGGNLLIQKHATGNTTDLLAGAHFSVSCPTAAPTVPISNLPVVVTGLVDSGHTAVVASYVAADSAWEASGTADPGFIGISGPSGTDCAVTETDPPAGYLLPATTTQHYTIPVGTSQTTVNWFNAPAVANLHLAKSADPASGSTVNRGSQIDYTLAYYNDGNAGATNATVTDTLPAHTTYVADSASNGGSYDDATRTITWTGVDVADGTSAGSPAGTRTFSVTVDADTANGTELDNTGHIRLTGQDAIDSNTTKHFVKFAVISAVKSSDPASGSVGSPTPVVPGQVITYTVTVTNSGQSDATDVSASDAIPAGTDYVDGSADHGGTLSGGSLSWSGLTVSTEAPLELHFQVTVGEGDANGTLIDNTASVNGSATNTTHHEVEFAVLGIAKSASPADGSIVQRGDQIDYTVTVTNTGLAAAAAQTVTDTLPANVTVVSGSISPTAQTADATHLVWSVDVPAASADGPGTVVLKYSATVDPDAPLGSTQTNVATLGNDSSTTEHHVPTGALTLVKHVDKTSAAYGATLTYTFDAASTGALDQTNVVVTDVLPAKTSYVNGSARCTDGGTCTATFDKATRTVTWMLGDLASGATARHLSFQVTIDTPNFDSQAGLPAETIVNAGRIASTETGSTPSNQVKTTVVAVLGVKVVRKPKLPFTGLPVTAALVVALTMLGAGVALTTVRRRQRG